MESGPAALPSPVPPRDSGGAPRPADDGVMRPADSEAQPRESEWRREDAKRQREWEREREKRQEERERERRKGRNRERDGDDD